MRRCLWGGLLLLLLLLLLGGSSCGKSKPPQQLPEGWTPGLEQLIPEDMDLVARIDWNWARQKEIQDLLWRYLKKSGLSEALLDAVDGCLEDAETLLVGLRFGPTGLDGDVMIVVSGSRKVGMPCGANGWKFAGKRRDLEVFEPLIPSSDRSAAALMMRSDRGEVVVVTPGQIDSLLRVLRDGPDWGRMEPKGEGLVVHARLDEGTMPSTWKQSTPILEEVAQALERAEVVVDVKDGVRVQVAMTYASEAMAEGAGMRLRDMRDAMTESEWPMLHAIASSAQASVQGAVLRLQFAVPLASVSTP